MFFKVFSVFPAVFKVVFSSFLSVSQKKKRKRSQLFFQSEVHLTRYNLSFNPRYTLLGIISNSIRDTPLTRYNLRRCQFRLFERFFKVLKNFLRFCSPFLRVFELKPLFLRFFWQFHDF